MLRKNILSAAVFTIISGLTLNAQTPWWKQGITVDEFIYNVASYPECHASTIAETPDGLVAAWFGGTRERHPDVGIWVSRLENGKWTPSFEVANGVQNDTLRYPTWNPVLYQIPGGELMLFYKIGPSPATWWGMLTKSADHGKTWGKPEALPEGFIGPVKNKPVLLKNGTLICPSSTEGNGGWQVHFELTNNFGKTWEKTGPINDGKIISVIQPSVLTFTDGSLQALCRSKNRAVIESRSFDSGRTWSKMKAIGLPNNNSGIDAVTLADGRHLLVYNHVLPPKGETKGARTPLNVAISNDGKTWYAALILEDSPISQYSYPSVIQTSDGMIHFVYTWRRERIKHVVADPSKLVLKKIKKGQWPK
jgi:alpha-L-rhamnosidase